MRPRKARGLPGAPGVARAWWRSSRTWREPRPTVPERLPWRFPRLRYDPAPAEPIVSEDAAARYGALATDIEVVRAEIQPAYALADRAALIGQNAFRRL